MEKLLVIIAALLWAGSGAVTQHLFAQTAIAPPELTTVRMGAAGLLFLAYSLCREQSKLRAADFRRQDWYRNLPLFGLIGIYGMQFTYFQAIYHGNAAAATVLQGLAPILIILWTVITTKKWPNVTDSVATFGAVIGVFLLVTGGRVGDLVIPYAAVFWGISSAFCAAFYMIYPRRLTQRIPMAFLLGWGMLMGTLMSIALTGLPSLTDFLQPVVLRHMLYIVLLGTVAPFFLFLYGLRRLPPAVAGVLLCVEPLSVVVFSILFLGMRFGFGELLGICLVVGAVALMSWSKEPRP
ncbi:MAG: DMT family transporter [Veillonellaceae bacterium]|nr:DMT family transporter [Veillonellaceae bacterium]